MRQCWEKYIHIMSPKSAITFAVNPKNANLYVPATEGFLNVWWGVIVRKGLYVSTALRGRI